MTRFQRFFRENWDSSFFTKEFFFARSFCQKFRRRAFHSFLLFMALVSTSLCQVPICFGVVVLEKDVFRWICSTDF